MSKEKISSQEIVELVSVKASVSKRAAEEFLKVMISSVEEALKAGDIVKIKGFGTFKLQWVEPRKSVNVNTQEDILLDGYHKVTFTPDATLKDLVNEPFAHLSSISLDANNETIQEDTTQEPPLDPLRIFEEQASEIKSLISEINALSTSSKSKKKEILPTQSTEIQDYDLSDFILNEDVAPNAESVVAIAEDIPIQEEVHVVEPETHEESVNSILNESIRLTEEVEIPKVDEVSIEEPYTGNPFIKDFKPKSKRKVPALLWVLLITVLLSGVGTIAYMYCLPVNQITNNVVANVKSFTTSTYQNIHFTDFITKIKGLISAPDVKVVIPETVIVPKDASSLDSLSKAQPVDSLQLLFDSPREYSVTIATERITSGSRLARMAERYYGKSDFWVYIYEANSPRLKHPDSIASGTLIYIPKVDARLIDPINPRCIEKAKELHDLYIRK